MADIVSSLPAPDKVGAFAALDDGDQFETTYPVFENAPDGSPRRVIGLLLFISQTTYALAYNPDRDAWERVTTSTRNHTVFNDVDDYTARHVVLVDEDIDSELATVDALFDQLKTYYGDVFDDTLDDLDEDNQHQFTEDELSFTCTCNGRDHHGYLPMTEDLLLRQCKDCTALPGVRFRGEYIPMSEVLSAEWLRNYGVDTDIDTTDADIVFATAERDEMDRTDVAVYVLSFVAKLTDYRMAMYNHSAFSAVVHARDGVVTGYATWNTGFDDARTPILRQLYVRPEFRREGVGSALVNARMRHAVDGHDHVYVDDPNDAGWAVYEQLGYVEGNNRDTDKPRAVPVRVLEPRPAFPDGKANPFAGQV